MKVAVLGCGGLGRIHAEAYAAMDDVTLTAVCDRQFEAAVEVAGRTGARAFASFEDMVREAEFEVLSIALPSSLHKPYTIAAAQAGKHVVSEKPIALTLEDAEEMIRACEDNGVRLFVGHVVRFFPDYAHMKATFEQGRLGRAGVAHASRVGPHPADAKAWFGDVGQSGGVIVDLMIHDLDFLRWTFGEVRTVYALNRRDECLDYALATLQFENGAVANVEAHWGDPGPFRTKAEIAGSGGIVAADSLKSSSLHIRRAASAADSTPAVSIPQSPGYRSPYELELRHFIDCIRGGTEPIVTARDAYKALELALAARASAESGAPVQLPLSATASGR